MTLLFERVSFIPLVLFYSNISSAHNDLVVSPAKVGNQQFEPEALKKSTQD